MRLNRRGETGKGGNAERRREGTEKDLDPGAADIEKMQRYRLCIK